MQQFLKERYLVVLNSDRVIKLVADSTTFWNNCFRISISGRLYRMLLQ